MVHLQKSVFRTYSNLERKDKRARSAAHGSNSSTNNRWIRLGDFDPRAFALPMSSLLVERRGLASVVPPSEAGSPCGPDLLRSQPSGRRNRSPVAGNDDRDGIASIGKSDCADRRGIADPPGELRVADRFAVANQ
jgi:hypothetical protein